LVESPSDQTPRSYELKVNPIEKSNDSNDHSLKHMANTVFDSIVVDGYMAEKYFLNEDGKLNTYTIVKISSIVLSILLAVLIVYNMMKERIIGKSSEKALKDYSIPLPKDSSCENKVNTISLKGRTRKVPKNINYGELFLNFDQSEKNSLKMEDNTPNNVIDFIGKCDTKSNMNTSIIEPIIQNNKMALPKSKNDLLFSEDCVEEPKEVKNIDTNLEFLKEVKSVVEAPIETESEKIINRLRHSGNFHQTEISRLAKK